MKTIDQKKLIEKTLKKVQKLNSHWVDFFWGVLAEHRGSKKSIAQIVKREFNRVRPEMDMSKHDEIVTVKFIELMAKTRCTDA